MGPRDVVPPSMTTDIANRNLVESVERSWERLRTWLSRFAPELLERFPGGASDENLTKIESELGLQLPADYRRFLELVDGTASQLAIQPVWAQHTRYSAWAIYGADEARQAWQQLRTLLAKSLNDASSSVPAQAVPYYFPHSLTDDHDGTKAAQDGVRALDWNLLWLPIGDPQYSRQRLCIDLDPALGGTRGQVIYVGIGDSFRTLIAKSFAELFEQSVNAMEDGRIVAAEDEEEDGYFHSICSRESAERDCLRIRLG